MPNWFTAGGTQPLPLRCGVENETGLCQGIRTQDGTHRGHHPPPHNRLFSDISKPNGFRKNPSFVSI